MDSRSLRSWSSPSPPRRWGQSPADRAPIYIQVEHLHNTMVARWRRLYYIDCDSVGYNVWTVPFDRQHGRLTGAASQVALTNPGHLLSPDPMAFRELGNGLALVSTSPRVPTATT